jgi:caffeoyl-CoA O-methyltransferase
MNSFNLNSPLLNAYLEQHTDAETPLLKKLNRETHAKVLLPRMLSGHFQGNLLKMLSHMIQPRRILEIGTFTGYSALCLCEGLQEDGLLHTIDINEELSEFVNRYVNQAGLHKKILIHSGPALSIIPNLKEVFDLVFIDADKANYPLYYDLVFEKVRKGGYIISDNVLWNGKVLQDPVDMDKDTKAMHAFNKKVQEDTRVEKIILPVRDGLFIARKLI